MGKKENEEREEKELDAVREAIKSKKLRWKAAKTNVTRMSEEDQKNLLGALIEDDKLKRILKRQEEKEKKRERASSEGEAVDPPPEWDWRNVAGDDWTTPIKNQSLCGSCGSCVAFSVVAALEMMVKRWMYNNPAVTPDFSEAQLYFCNNRSCTRFEPNYGWWIDQALDVLKADGVPDECCYPYAAGPTQPCDPCDDWRERVTKIKDWQRITDITTMKKLLSEHGCLIANFVVYRDFNSYVGGIYEHAWGDYRGNHAVTVVGYDDVDECWICKNSWGPCWGEAKPGQPLPNPAGWFRIAYDECGIDDEMYAIELLCPAEVSAATIGVDEKTTQMVREFRDKLLTTRRGRAYLYRAARDIGAVTRVLRILKKDHKIRDEAAKALQPFIAAIRTMDTKRPLKLEEEHFKAARSVLDQVAKVDPKLTPIVKRIKEEMPRYVGKDLTQILQELQ